MLTHTTHTAPAGTTNEDWYLTTDNLVLVLDGATVRTETGCIHGLPWFVMNLGLQLATAASGPAPLVDCIATAIREVRAMHADSCDLSHPGTPSAALGIVRERDQDLEYAVLGDVTIAFEVAGQRDAHVVVDPRVSHVGVEARAEADRHLIGTAEKNAALLAMKERELADRNRAGGYWIASVDPTAADEALSGAIERDRVARFATCTDGAMRALEMTSLNSHAGMLTALRRMGPVELVAMVRAAEARDPLGRRWPRNKTADDATIVYTELQGTPAATPPTPEQQQRALASLDLLRHAHSVMGERIPTGHHP